jgi:hypothetical protein
MDTPGNLWITPWRELRIRRLGVRVPPSAPHLTRENAAEAGGRLGVIPIPVPIAVGMTGVTTAVIREHFDGWAARVGPEIVGDWIFAPDYRRAIYTRASLLSHRFVRLRDRAAVPDAALHRFRPCCGHRAGRSRQDPQGPGPSRAPGRHHAAPLRPRHTTRRPQHPDDLDRRLNEAAG